MSLLIIHCIISDHFNKNDVIEIEINNKHFIITNKWDVSLIRHINYYFWHIWINVSPQLSNFYSEEKKAQE